MSESKGQATVRVGFEAAIDKFIPNWRELPQGVIDSYRSFYAQGIQDARIFVASATDTLKQGFDYFDKSVTEEGMVPRPTEASVEAPAVKASTKPSKAKAEPKKGVAKQAKTGTKKVAKGYRKQ